MYAALSYSWYVALSYARGAAHFVRHVAEAIKVGKSNLTSVWKKNSNLKQIKKMVEARAHTLTHTHQTPTQADRDRGRSRDRDRQRP